METHPHCLNCDSELGGPYCPQCGQRHVDRRLTVRGFLRGLPSRLFSLDRGFLHTFLALSRNPGSVAHDYVRGKRAYYTSPLAFWLIAATVQLLALSSVHEPYVAFLEGQLELSMETQPEAAASYRELLQVDDPVPILAGYMMTATKAAYSYLGVILALLFAAALRLLTSFGKRPYLLAEQFVFALYVIGYWALVTGILMPLTFRLSPMLHSALGTGGYLIVAAVGSLGFHHAGGRGAIMTMVSFAAAFAVYLVFLAVVVTFVMIVAISAA